MPIAGSNINLDSTEGMDKISQTEKVTTPYFSNGNTELLATNITSSTHIAGTTNDQYLSLNQSFICILHIIYLLINKLATDS